MGKINKYANIYSKDCTSENCKDHLIRPTIDGQLKDYSLEELEKLVDDLGNDKDDNGHIRNKQAFNNASSMLFQYYQKYGNPHKDELIHTLTKERSIEEQTKDALNSLKDEYIDYEEA